MTWPLTPWYGADTPPVRAGIYIVHDGVRVGIGKWDGAWNWPMVVKWCGLAFDPASVQPTFRFIGPDDAGGAGWWVPKP
jgi:hypothetical protein